MAGLHVHRIPRVCYRATDRARPRWRCVLCLINRGPTDRTVEAVRVLQRRGAVRRQCTYREERLARCFVQGSAAVTAQSAAVGLTCPQFMYRLL